MMHADHGDRAGRPDPGEPTPFLTPLESEILSVLVREKTGREIRHAILHERHPEIAREDDLPALELSYGSLYVTLRRMKIDGLVVSRNGRDEDGEPVRYWSRTGTGRRAFLAHPRKGLGFPDLGGLAPA